MGGNRKVNSDLDILGKIKISTVPNNMGTVLTYNSSTKEISTRSNAEVVSDLGLVTTSGLNTTLSDYSVKSANETFGGVKTFTLSPIIPNATSLNHAVNKEQLDAKIPYTGATANVNLGTNNQIKAKEFDAIGAYSEKPNTNRNYEFLKLNGSAIGVYQSQVWNGSAWVDSLSYGFGYFALHYNTGACSNGFGYSALRNNTGANSNGFGYYALHYNIGANSNGFGYASLQYNTGASSNGFGTNILRYNTGANNSVLGFNSFSNFYADTANAKLFDATAIDMVAKTITIPNHGFGANGTYTNLRFVQGDSAVTGLSNGTIVQVKIIDANTIAFEEVIQAGQVRRIVNITNAGTGTGHKFEPQKSLSNINILGANINPTKSNQTIFAGGEAILPQATVATIDADATNKALITKEWYNSKINASLSNYYTKSEAVNMFVGLNGVQTIGGTKTFKESPVVPNPTLSTHAVNKGYVDGLTHPTYKNTTIPGRVMGDYQFHVVPLCELTNDNISADRYTSVKVLLKRNNALNGLVTELKITVAKCYNADIPFISFNYDKTSVDNLSFRIVTFTYNGKKYIGLNIRVIADYTNPWVIEGYSNQWSIISAINYYTQNTNTIVNSEIHGSIVEYVPDANINFNPDRKFSSGIESYGFKKVGSSDGHILLGNGGHRQLTDFMLSTHPANDITTTNINNWNTAFGWDNHANAGYAMANHTHNWNDIENKPLTFVPTSHTHAISEVTGLSTELDEKSEKNTDEEWNSKKYLSNPFPLIFNDPTENTRRFGFHKPNNISSVILVPSTEPDSDNWDWANQIEFKENGKIKNNGYEIAGYDDNYVNTSGGNQAHKKDLLWTKKDSYGADGSTTTVTPKGLLTTVHVLNDTSIYTRFVLPRSATNGQKILFINDSPAAWVEVFDFTETIGAKAHNSENLEFTFVRESDGEGVLVGNGNWHAFSYVDGKIKL